jgi:arylsulfatase A-like enzyme
MDKKMNVVWFCTDQQRYDTLGCMGNDAIETPNLDRLAREGMLFRRTYTQSPICTPSRACFLTGRYPRETRDLFNGNEFFSKDEKLVTRLLADEGYRCGLVGKLHLTAAEGKMERRCDDGYSYMKWSHHPHDDWEPGVNAYQEWLKGKGLKWSELYQGQYTSMSQWPPVQNPKWTGKNVGVPAKFHQTTWCVDEAISFMEQQKESGDGWLVSINPFDPHPPLDPPQEYKDRLSVEDMPLPLWKDGELDNKPDIQRHDYRVGGQNGAADSIVGMGDEEKKEKIRDYYAQIELIDDNIGRLLEYLDESGQRENTLVIFMSDHGEMSGDHGLYWKGAYFYEGLVHVPLIVSCPGTVKENVSCSALVELVDVAPTILDLLGYEVPYCMSGKSFAKILTGEAPADRFKDSVYCEFYSVLRGCHDDIFATMYFDGRYKIVVYHGKEYGELYDLGNDPCEFDNLWDDPACSALKERLVRKNFDAAILKNMDWSMHKVYGY